MKFNIRITTYEVHKQGDVGSLTDLVAGTTLEFTLCYGDNKDAAVSPHQQLAILQCLYTLLKAFQPVFSGVKFETLSVLPNHESFQSFPDDIHCSHRPYPVRRHGEER